MNKEILFEIIKSSELNTEEKIVFNEIFSEVIKNYENIISELKKQVINSLSNNIEIMNICTRIVDKDKLSSYKKVGFGILGDNKECIKNHDLEYYCTGLLKCKYSNLKSYCKKTYEGSYVDKKGTKKPIKYKFSYNLSAIEKEIILDEIARQYNIETNIVYSPYSRRMVDIHLITKEELDKESIDLELEKNKLEDILQLDKYLVWNVKIENVTQAETIDYTNAYQDKLNYIHEFKYEENKYISCDVEVIDIIKDDKKIKIVTRDPDAKFEIIKISKIDEIDLNIFSNNVNFTNGLERLRTKSQINHAINQYLLPPFENCVIDILTENNNRQLIEIYENVHRNKRETDEFLIKSYSKELYIVLDNSEEEFAEDFYNYLVDNLNYKYPEFKWIGVY